MASLDEIRKRFAKANSADDGNGFGTPSAATSALGRAALKLFDPLKNFEVQVSEITKVAEPLERVLNQTARTLEEVKVFSAEMERLAKAYEGIRTFQAALNAEAARELRQQFDGIERAFYENLSTAGRAARSGARVPGANFRVGENLRWAQTSAGEAFGAREKLQTTTSREQIDHRARQTLDAKWERE